jgi:signal transduction histidine kinase
MLRAMSGRDETHRLLTLAVHELRTPLNVAAGYLRMLLDPRSGRLADRQAQFAGKAAESLETLARHVADLNEIARLDSGELALTPRRHDLATLTASVVEALALEQKTPRPVLHAEPGSFPADIDVERVARALRACLRALAREVPDPGLLVVSLARRDSFTVQVTLGSQGLGSGLDPAAGAWGPPDEWGGGLGLELPLARRVIERHGGRLLSRPGPGHGSAFLIVLPLAAAGSSAQAG